MWQNTTIIRDNLGLVLFKSEYVTPDQNREFGKNLRIETPRSPLSSWIPPIERKDPIEILEESNRGRLEHLIPIRYGRMLKSPFAFYRGAAALMAYDLSMMPRSGITVQACGDCHLLNFGLFATPERNLVFDLNDFDETQPAPFEWDLKRLTASLYIASQSNGYTESEAKKIVLESLATYRKAIEKFSFMKVLDIWYLKLSMDDIIAAAKTEQTKKNRLKRTDKKFQIKPESV